MPHVSMSIAFKVSLIHGLPAGAFDLGYFENVGGHFAAHKSRDFHQPLEVVNHGGHKGLPALTYQFGGTLLLAVWLVCVGELRQYSH